MSPIKERLCTLLACFQFSGVHASIAEIVGKECMMCLRVSCICQSLWPVKYNLLKAEYRFQSKENPEITLRMSKDTPRESFGYAYFTKQPCFILFYLVHC